MSRSEAFRPASFRGVPFKTKGNGKSHGRRGTHHEYPGRDRGWIDDAGQADAEITLDAYVVGDDWIARRDALEAALLQPGAGRLVHPTRGPLDVVPRPGRWSVRERSSEQGMAVFRLSFVEADDVPQFPEVTAARSTRVRNASAILRAAAIEATARSLNISGPEWIARAARADITALVDEIEGVAVLASSVDPASGALPGGIETLTAGDGAALVEATAFAADIASATDWLNTIINVGLFGLDLLSGGWKSYLKAFGAGALDGILGALGLRDLFGTALRLYGLIDAIFFTDAPDGSRPLRSANGAWVGSLRLLSLPEPVQTEDSISGARTAANARALHRLVRLSAIAIGSQAAIRRSYDSTGAAIDAMRILDREIESEILREAGRNDPEADTMIRNLTDLRAVTREVLLTTVADTAPVIRRDIPESLPSLALCWRLTAEIDSEPDIIARNAITHPLFCPAGTIEYRAGGADA